jgi:hypothetical protein
MFPLKCISHIAPLAIFDARLRVHCRILSIIQTNKVDIGMLLRADIKFLQEMEALLPQPFISPTRQPRRHSLLITLDTTVVAVSRVTNNEVIITKYMRGCYFLYLPFHSSSLSTRRRKHATEKLIVTKLLDKFQPLMEPES